MGGEGGFMEKIMALLGQGGGKPPVPAPSPEPRVPWETPMSGAPVTPPGMHVMPGGQVMPDSAMPPESIADDPMAQAVELARKRRMVQKMIPDFVNR